MARPFLADPEFVRKTEEGRVDEINTCIGCNQACLDHTFGGKRASCLVNPRAGYESNLRIEAVPKSAQQTIAVVGAGPGTAAIATVLNRIKINSQKILLYVFSWIGLCYHGRSTGSQRVVV